MEIGTLWRVPGQSCWTSLHSSSLSGRGALSTPRQRQDVLHRSTIQVFDPASVRSGTLGGRHRDWHPLLRGTGPEGTSELEGSGRLCCAMSGSKAYEPTVTVATRFYCRVRAGTLQRPASGDSGWEVMPSGAAGISVPQAGCAPPGRMADDRNCDSAHGAPLPVTACDWCGDPTEENNRYSVRFNRAAPIERSEVERATDYLMCSPFPSHLLSLDLNTRSKQCVCSECKCKSAPYVATHCAALVLVLMGSKSSTYISLLCLVTACWAHLLGLYYPRAGSVANTKV